MDSGTAGRIGGIVFDFDGTLTSPSAIDFGQIREDVGCPRSVPILEYIEGLATAGERAEAMAILHRHEMAAARRSRPNRDAEAVVRHSRDRLGLPLAILTRNSREAVEAALASFTAVSAVDFALVLTRDDALPPKPDPAGVLAAAATLGVAPGQLLMVGDYRFDVEAGRAAGAVTALLTNGTAPVSTEGADYVVERLLELLELPGLRSPR